jgi:LysM repeat protein
VIILVATTLGGGESDSDSVGGSPPAAETKQGNGSVHTPKSYVVQSGDTLTSIAHENGVTVAQILKLNPGVDPQILVSGEKLKLR